MAPVSGPKLEKEKRLHALLGFSAQLQKRLDAGHVDDSISEDIGSQLKMHMPVPPPAKAAEIDGMGTRLWNTSLRLRQQRPDLTSPRLLSQLRVFGFFLIDLAHRAMPKQPQKAGDNLIRILRTALKAARTCINSNELELATRVFECAATYLEPRNPERGHQREPQNGNARAQENMIMELVAEYQLLRATLSWKQDRTDVAAHWLSKMSYVDCAAHTQLAEKKADLMYEMGVACLRKNQFEDAIKWLEGSCETIDAVDRDLISEDCCELRMSVVGAWVRALLGMNKPASIAKASKLVTLLENESGYKMAASVLRLSVLFADQPVRTEEILSVLLRIIRSSIITEGAFKVIMHQIQKLRDQDPNFACQALDSMLPRLYEMHPKAQPMLEKVVVTRVWMTVSRPHNDKQVFGLRSIFDEIWGTTGTPMGPEATHATQSLIWRKTTSTNETQLHGPAEAWCRLACHPLLQKAGDLNKSKLARKLMLIALAKGDGATARESYFQMSESGKAAPITKYILYKVALRTADADLASESLEGLLNASAKDPSFLYACALGAQQHGDRRQAIAVLQRILEHNNYSAPAGVYLPSLLRCTAAAIITEMKDKRIAADVALPELCKIFEGAMAQASRFRDAGTGPSTDDQYRAEIRWFASYSYNLSLQHCGDMRPELLVRLMTVCITFVSLLRQENIEDGSLVVRLLFCHFLAASGLVVLGRSEDNVEQALKFYLDVRRQAEAFYKLQNRDMNSESIGEETRSDVAAKQFEILKYDLEAVLKLEHWNDLDRVLEMCLEQKHTSRWESATDLIIHIHTHILKTQLDPRYQAKIPAVLEKIINISWRTNMGDSTKLARWLRCLFQMTLSIDPAMSLKCLDQACAIANSPKMQAQYPVDELEWLATTSFNHAVDLHCASDDAASQQWAERALALALAAGLGSGLHRVLQAKWLQMQVKSG
ncbi:hypothetical protein MBLNU459_g3456t2 [Dothideomycetes sp. NU459]